MTMRTPQEGAVYEDTNTGEKLLCIKSPDTFGVPTHKAENMEIEFKTVEDGQWFTIFVDNFRGSYRKVADSLAEV